ncbi:hypothetical protein T4D_10116 [Trichinella pseudospiralis]|uniref:Uncharacterized protein n=1 Tax=Trichinella pseudospiralis TaxID=6337 RepID=A0A0V1DN78_TRIPS|nr:hypothetical protein T4D_10116 [Trichinella pseudospiralis]
MYEGTPSGAHKGGCLACILRLGYESLKQQFSTFQIQFLRLW